MNLWVDGGGNQMSPSFFGSVSPKKKNQPTANLSILFEGWTGEGRGSPNNFTHGWHTFWAVNLNIQKKRSTTNKTHGLQHTDERVTWMRRDLTGNTSRWQKEAGIVVVPSLNLDGGSRSSGLALLQQVCQCVREEWRAQTTGPQAVLCPLFKTTHGYHRLLWSVDLILHVSFWHFKIGLCWFVLVGTDLI